ncbi:MAG TPA: hypothetical protein VI485_03775, partial [Vicinamibacterales bacterium]|nr:hypothetical protein [Vicinamibacterales bacterium]
MQKVGLVLGGAALAIGLLLAAALAHLRSTGARYCLGQEVAQIGATNMPSMIMTPRVRKFALTTHVTSSVGWLGAVAAFLALAVAGVSSADAQLVRAAYLAMHLITWYVIVPFSVAALVTGLVQSLGTPWGVFRHYWIVAKLGLTVVATLILFAHTQPIAQVATVASQTLLASGDLRQLRIRLIADAGAALMALLVAT